MYNNNLIHQIKLSVNFPPPTSAKSCRKLYAILAVVLIIIILVPLVLVFSGALNIGPTTNPTPTPTANTSAPPVSTETPGGTTPPPSTSNVVLISSGSKVSATTQTIGSSGGTIQVTDSSSPLYGLKIVVPAAATSEPVQFEVSYADIVQITGLPSGASAASKLITIHATGSADFNQYQMFDAAIEVTLPYDSTATNDDNKPVRFYWYDALSRQT